MVAGAPVVAARPGELRAHLAPQQTGRDGRVRLDANVVQARARILEITPDDSEPGHLQCHDGGLAVVPLALQLLHHGVAHTARARVWPPTAISATTSTASARAA